MYLLRKAIPVILAMIAQQAAEMKNFKPLDEATGTDTAIDRQISMMITDQRQFVQVWREHKEVFGEGQGGNVAVVEAQVPKVDFKKNVVFVYFAGQTQGIDGYELGEINTKGKTATVNIVPHYFVNNLISNSYGMWVFPRPTKPVELQLVIGMDKGKPVTKKIGRFEPPKDQKDSRTSGGTSTGS
jgi:hypothetical protein